MTATTTGRCRNGSYSGNLIMFAVSAMVVILATTFVYAEYYETDLSGPLCEKIKKCCNERKDECSVPLDGTRCYCDAFCVNSTSKDCCPDYWTYCRHEIAPLGGFVTQVKEPYYAESIAKPESITSDDELDRFFKCIAATVRKLPKHIMVQTKTSILQIVSQNERLNVTCNGVRTGN